MHMRIFSPSKSPMQSGPSKTGWHVEVAAFHKVGRDRVMGWSSSQDMNHALKLVFPKLCDAIQFCMDKRWTYEIFSAEKESLKPKNYAENFTHELRV